MSITTILDTGKQALFAQQRAIQVVGQNIANVNTPGYSRERPEFLPARPTHTIRYGVSVEEVTRAYDRFVTAQVNRAANQAASAKTQADLLGQIEAIFNDLNLADAGLAGVLERFFDGFQDLAANPAGVAERSTVQVNGQIVADTFHILHDGLEDMRRNVQSMMRDELDQANQLVQQIADLNGSIQVLEADPNTHANTARDERDLLLKQLSEKIAITSFEDENGKLTVLLGGGRPLIEGSVLHQLTAVTDADDPLRATIYMQDSEGTLIDVSHHLSSGKLVTLTALNETLLPSLSTDVDRLAAQLISAVNEVHSAGYDLDGGTGQVFFAPRQVTGQALAQNAGGGVLQSATVYDPTQLTRDEYRLTFVGNGPPATFDIVNATTGATLAAGQTYTSGAPIRFDGIELVIADSGSVPQQGDVYTVSTTQNAAKNIVVDPDILSNVRNIVAARTPPPGDNAQALALADLGSTARIDGLSLSEFYNTLVSRVGADSQKAQDLATHQDLLLTEVENQREAMAGVSLDEEQIDLIRFQQAYNSAAQLIRVADELADVVVNLIQ